MMDLESIQHATTFLQWHKGNYYIFEIKPSLQFTQWNFVGHLIMFTPTRSYRLK
jgi:hypothetical protein